MNNSPEVHSDVRKHSLHFFALMTRLRPGLKSLCLTLVVVAAATLLAAAALPSEGPSAALSGAAASGKSHEPSRLEKAYQERATRNPWDLEASEGMAILQVQRGDYAEAIASYRHILEFNPNDHDAKMGLGRALAFDVQYDAALREFQEVMEKHPGDSDALEGLARVTAWAGRSDAALLLFANLAGRYPANPEYAVGLARVEMNLHQYPQARKTLMVLVSANPRNRDAQLQLAYLDLYEGHEKEALRRFNYLISQDPTDVGALKGNVRVAYHRGDLVYARNLAAKIVDDNPRDADALLLLANLERALHDSRRARALLYRAETADPRNEEEGNLETSLRSDAQPTMHTSASWARETGSGSSPNAEDLTAYGYENTWGFSALPRSQSYLSLAYLPSQSPNGGIQGAVGPSQAVYRQTTYITPLLTLRGGVGLARFGPGMLTSIPTQDLPITSAGMRPLGFVGTSYAMPKRKLTVDLTAARSAITYTPTAVRLGVMEDRLSLGLDYHFNASTELRLEPFAADDFTISYAHEFEFADAGSSQFHEAEHNRAVGTSVTFNRRLLQRSRTTFDIGYSGLAYGLAGGSERPYLGIFNPGFYQRHYLTTYVAGKIHGPLGFDISTGTGVQQVEHATPIKPALLFSPAFTLKASPRLSLTLGYTHYDSSQSLGTLSGNAVRLSTDYRF
jgi:tetratricopeptide (TPR) repeat protein